MLTINIILQRKINLQLLREFLEQMGQCFKFYEFGSFVLILDSGENMLAMHRSCILNGNGPQFFDKFLVPAQA